MKKNISYLIIIALILFVCIGCNCERNTSSTDSVYSDTQALGISSANSEDSSADTSATAANVVYDIYGVSNKLSANSADEMKKWRAKAKTYGEQFSSAVFLNDQPQSNTVYLTFDDGPDHVITPQVVDILAENNACGNFFFIGKYLKKYKDIVKKAHENKNYVGSHCFTHSKLTAMSSEQVKKELTDTSDAIKNITGVAPSFVRPPYGDINNQVISDFEDLNCKIVLWSIDTLDWSQKDASNIVKNVTEHLRPGDIILMHCNSDKKETAKALPEIIKAIKGKGYTMGTFNEFGNQQN